LLLRLMPGTELEEPIRRSGILGKQGRQSASEPDHALKH
jgi:hypothetical protein